METLLSHSYTVLSQRSKSKSVKQSGSKTMFSQGAPVWVCATIFFFLFFSFCIFKLNILWFWLIHFNPHHMILGGGMEVFWGKKRKKKKLHPPLRLKKKKKNHHPEGKKKNKTKQNTSIWPRQIQWGDGNFWRKKLHPPVRLPPKSQMVCPW